MASAATNSRRERIHRTACSWRRDSTIAADRNGGSRTGGGSHVTAKRLHRPLRVLRRFGLIYETVWTRRLTLELGHTTAAAGTVLAAFMGGLAIGALVGGALVSRVNRQQALKAYAALELLVALSALALPFALRAAVPLLVLAYGEEPGALFATARLACCLALVFVPAAAMGATFPLAVRVSADESTPGWRQAGALYAANTVGAAVGAVGAGFLLIPAIGLRATTLVGVAFNVVAGGGAWLMSRRQPAMVSPPRVRPQRPASRAPARRRPPPVETPNPRWLPLALVGVSGFAALVYEVTFTRALAISLGPTTYAFAAMLTAFIVGLAIGAAVASRVQWTRVEGTCSPLAT